MCDRAIAQYNLFLMDRAVRMDFLENDSPIVVDTNK